MKNFKTLFFLILFCQLSSLNAQKTLNGFLNIPFGINIDTAKNMLLKRQGVKFIRENEYKTITEDKSRFIMRIFLFTGVSIGGFKADTCIILSDLLIKNKFLSGALIFNNHSEGFHSEIFDILKEKYGEPDKTWSYKGGIMYWWYFLPEAGKFYKNEISLNWVFERSISLSYSGAGTIESKFKNPIIEKWKKKLDEF